jgi:hypothetical protein
MQLSIADTGIRQDQSGRFSFNDLHKAAGGDKAHQPANFLRLDSTVALIEEISNSSEMRSYPVESGAGRYGGTYASKEVVYAYAMWISPKFHLQVIRAYDALATGDTAKAEAIARPAKQQDPLALSPKVAKAFLGFKQIAEACGLEGNHALLSANQATMTVSGMNCLQLLGHEKLKADERGRTYTPTELGQMMEPTMSARAYNELLLKEGYITRNKAREVEPTELGKPLGEWVDTGRKHSNGSPVKQWRWFNTIGKTLKLAA